MGKLLALVMGWLSKNIIQRALMGAGLGLVSYFGILVAIRTAFDKMINSAYSMPADLLNLMGIYGIDYNLSTFVSVAVFLLTLNQGKLMLRKK
ncbi:DUF2523 family protein [Acinetobacter sp. WCHAc060025]|uniref:DUF2523 family protein n=1 Tax=Acinetobacter sp. WCHAc060025 TaxID=2518625 RepID=UPI0013EECC37|nr:DUF2523 family protein [Acinetobacter sp. WCHAc060025]